MNSPSDVRTAETDDESVELLRMDHTPCTITAGDLMALTVVLDEHPDWWEHPCWCAVCRSYADG